MFGHVSTAEGRPIAKSDAVDGPEAIGLIVGDHIHALYGFKSGVTATFESRRYQRDAGLRHGVQLFGSEGIMWIAGLMRMLLIYEAPIWQGTALSCRLLNVISR